MPNLFTQLWPLEPLEAPVGWGFSRSVAGTPAGSDG